MFFTMSTSATFDFVEVPQYNICSVQYLFQKIDRHFSKWKTKRLQDVKRDENEKRKKGRSSTFSEAK